MSKPTKLIEKMQIELLTYMANPRDKETIEYVRELFNEGLKPQIIDLLQAVGEEIIKSSDKVDFVGTEICGWDHDKGNFEEDMCRECDAIKRYIKAQKLEQRSRLKEIIDQIKK